MSDTCQTIPPRKMAKGTSTGGLWLSLLYDGFKQHRATLVTWIAVARSGLEWLLSVQYLLGYFNSSEKNWLGWSWSCLHQPQPRAYKARCKYMLHLLNLMTYDDFLASTRRWKLIAIIKRWWFWLFKCSSTCASYLQNLGDSFVD
jgi:hypothetical protein